MQTLIQTSLFDPLIEYIYLFNYKRAKGREQIEIRLPLHFEIDTDKVIQYLGNDATLEVTRGGARTLKGSVTTELADYLHNKMMGKLVV